MQNLQNQQNDIVLAKHKAAVTPINPKNGADVGQVSYDTVESLIVKVLNNENDIYLSQKG